MDPMSIFDPPYIPPLASPSPSATTTPPITKPVTSSLPPSHATHASPPTTPSPTPPSHPTPSHSPVAQPPTPHSLTTAPQPTHPMTTRSKVDPRFLQTVITSLSKEFAMTDLGDLHHFLGIAVTRDKSGLFLSQAQYAQEILQRAYMSNCKPCAILVDTDAKLSADNGPLLPDVTLYRSLVGALQYLTFTCPDITYAVQQIMVFNFGLLPPRHLLPILMLIGVGVRILADPRLDIVFSWGGGGNLLSWSSKRQSTVSRSSAEAEYLAVANAVSEVSWLRNLLLELHVPVRTATVVYCDNVLAVYLSGNPVHHQRTKHIEIDIHFVREKGSY
ncbi:hypothetical protein SSX86_029806 [Deinandra increscens subsp. villosa]|uniref:Reverse transcriptase Ty1/copia-type domain-containing protein n=1 Tax=Deinandra increscens subsp. villosa TaxID=3103831 RepID=A0AAP0GM50_9ASTR